MPTAKTQDWRIIVKAQRDLWADGVRAGTILGDVESVGIVRGPDDGGGRTRTARDSNGNGQFWNGTERLLRREMGAVRARPGRVLRRHAPLRQPVRSAGRNRGGPLGGSQAVATPSSCPRTSRRRCWRRIRATASSAATQAARPAKDVESGKLKIVQAGDGSVHPIEAKHLAPEVHSLMKVDRPVVRAADLDRVVLLVREPMEKLKTRSPWVWRYLRYGMSATFASSKSKPVPLPKRSTCRRPRAVVRL